MKKYVWSLYYSIYQSSVLYLKQLQLYQLAKLCADPEGRQGVPTALLIGFLSNTCPDPLKNHNATKRAFNIGPSSARQRNVIHQISYCIYNYNRICISWIMSFLEKENKSTFHCQKICKKTSLSLNATRSFTNKSKCSNMANTVNVATCTCTCYSLSAETDIIARTF